MFCHKCGCKAIEGASFCEKCGAMLIKDVEETAENNANITKDVLSSSESENCSENPGLFANNAAIEHVPPVNNTGDSESVTPVRFYDGDSSSNVKSVIIFLLVLAVIIVILILLGKLIFSSVYTMVGIPAGAYFIYQVWISQHIAKKKYEDSNKLKLPENSTSKFLLESLSGKFNYPYFKEVRYGENGECIIEGKYGIYPIEFKNDDCAVLKYISKKEDESLRLVLLEAIAIHNYLIKFFNPLIQVDTTKDIKALKSAEWQVKTSAFIYSVASVLIVIFVILGFVFPSGVINFFKPGAEVRQAYLSQYSSSITIEEAFNNFFGDPDWFTYESEGYSYVAFKGTCIYNDEKADVMINFKITGENFMVDSMDINGQPQNNLIIRLMLSKVYEESNTDSDEPSQTGSALDSILSDYYYQY